MNNKKPIYVLIEGANRVGKTTLIASSLSLFKNYTFIKLPAKVDLKLSIENTELFERLALEEIINLPKDCNLITDRGYISHVIYKVIRKLYKGQITEMDIYNELKREFNKILPLVRKADLIFLLMIPLEHYDKWFNEHVKRFSFLDDPVKFTYNVYITWQVYQRNFNKNTIFIPAYTDLNFQLRIIKTVKEVFNL